MQGSSRELGQEQESEEGEVDSTELGPKSGDEEGYGQGTSKGVEWSGRAEGSRCEDGRDVEEEEGGDEEEEEVAEGASRGEEEEGLVSVSSSELVL